MMNAPKLQLVPVASAGAADSVSEGAYSASPAEIHSELQRVLRSNQFDASARNRRFLEYVVEETLAGRADRIKAYNIATEVFGRDDSFNPQLDPVVRMEARRLRRSLERFYLVDHGSSSIQIAMPKGSYVATFENRAESGPAAPKLLPDRFTHAPRPYGPSILVAPFEVEGDHHSCASYNDGLVRKIAIGLSRFPEISAIASMPYPVRGSAGAGLSPTSSDLDFILTGNTAVVSTRLTATVTLVNARSGRVVWGETFQQDFEAGGILAARDRIAERIVRALAEECHATLAEDPGIQDADEPHRQAPFESLVRFHQYRCSLRLDMFQTAREQLQETILAHPAFAEAFACLSLVHSDGHRFGFAPADLHRRQAADYARKALELAPKSYRSHHALGIVQWLQGDVSASLESLQTAVALNPHALDTLADLGLHLCLLGEWARGVPLVEDALSGAVQAGLPRLGLALYHLREGHVEQALAEARQIRSPHVTHGLVAQAICLNRLGRSEEAAQAVARGRDVRPSFGTEFLLLFAGGNMPAALAAEIGSVFHDAGRPGA